jgi:hypothetical protein
MNCRPSLIMSPLIIVILTIVSSSYGQDAYEPEPSVIEAEMLRVDGDRMLSTPGEDPHIFISKPKPSPKNVKDSAAVSLPVVNQNGKIKIEKQTPAPKPTVQKQSKEEDESIMSFHFLYYMIQKYKLQDIVE